MVALAEEIYGGEAPWEAAPSWVVAPARTLWLDAAPEVLWARVVGRGQPLEGYEAEAFHRQVVQGYRVFAHEIAPRMALTRLDAAQPLEDVVAAAWAEVQAALAEGTRGAQVA
jgi:thymidylate kinase